MKIYWTVLATGLLSLGSSSAGSTAGTSAPVVTPVEAGATTIWSGVYTDDQARRGQGVYEAECAECHLDTLLGDGNAPALVGRTFFVRWGDLSIADMVSATRATMPQFAANTLSTGEYVDIAAYVLARSGVPSGESELPVDMDALAGIVVTEKSE